MKKWILIAVAVLFAGFIIAGVFAVKTASKMIDEKRKNILGLAVEVGSLKIDWALTRIIFKDVAIYPAGKVRKGDELASAEKLIFDISPMDIFKKKELHATEITFEKPDVSYIRYTRKLKNWDALDLSQMGGEKKDKTEAEIKVEEDGYTVRIDKLTINDGHAKYVDHADGGRMELNDLDVEVTDIVSEPDPAKLPTKLTISAQMGNTSGRINIKGKANVLSKGINFDVKSHLSSMPITYFSSFYAGKTPLGIRSGNMSSSGRSTAKESRLNSNNQINISGLRVTDGIKGEMVNKFILSKNDNLSFNVHVEGDLEKGDVSISHTAAKIITDQLIAQAMKETPVGQFGEAIKGTGKSIGEGGKKIGDKVKGLFGN
jgi:uncharacterized protein YycO